MNDDRNRSTHSRDLLIAWSLLPFMTPARARKLLELAPPIDSRLSSELAAYLSISEEDARAVRDPLQLPEVRRKVAKLRESVIAVTDEGYPPLLREIHDPPLVLHVRGSLELLSLPAIAVVGSRQASPYGLNATTKLASEIARSGLTIVSGLARGIDSAAHRAALAANGRTIAVLGTGIDVVYPRTSKRLFDEIASRGLLLSEFPEGEPPRRQNFPIRNRIISGLARGTVIAEATARSGSLITARMALEQGREVFAIPGPVFSPGSEGPHRLIQIGAKLLHTIDDLFEELPDLVPVKNRDAETPPLPRELGEVLEACSFHEPLHIDQISIALGRPPHELANPLLELELRGLIASTAGRYVRVVAGACK